MTRVLATSAIVAVLGGVVILGAQTQTQPQKARWQPPQLPPMETITGCLRPGPSPAVAVPGAAASTFVLADATMRSGDVPVGTSGTSTTYKLEGLAPPGVNLAELANKRVEVTGRSMKDRTEPTFSMRIVKQAGATCS